MSTTTVNDEMVLGMIMNPETPFEVIESRKAVQDQTKVASKEFEKQYDESSIAKYKASENAKYISSLVKNKYA